jgi:hypothetical protein
LEQANKNSPELEAVYLAGNSNSRIQVEVCLVARLKSNKTLVDCLEATPAAEDFLEINNKPNNSLVAYLVNNKNHLVLYSPNHNSISSSSSYLCPNRASSAKLNNKSINFSKHTLNPTQVSQAKFLLLANICYNPLQITTTSTI